MTAQARITQADILRARKAVEGLPNARIILRLAKAEIEIIVGEAANTEPPNPFDED